MLGCKIGGNGWGDYTGYFQKQLIPFFDNLCYISSYLNYRVSQHITNFRFKFIQIKWFCNIVICP